ncbi:MAG: hypothetical protein ABIP93_11180 [Gemmatimonadaceae bacterium]
MSTSRPRGELEAETEDVGGGEEIADRAQCGVVISAQRLSIQCESVVASAGMRGRKEVRRRQTQWRARARRRAIVRRRGRRGT